MLPCAVQDPILKRSQITATSLSHLPAPSYLHCTGKRLRSKTEIEGCL